MQASVEDLITVVQVAEGVGFDAVCVNDHVVMPKDSVGDLGRRWSDPIACMGFLAAETSRIRLYSAVLVTPYRSPLLTAKALATVDLLSAGRLTVGLAAGYLKAEFDALGIPFESRGAITDEYISAMKELWTTDFASFRGKHLRFSDVCIEPKPVQKPYPPIIVGGDTKAAMRRAARVGDGWHPAQVRPEQLPDCIAYIHAQPEFAAHPRPFDIVTPLAALNADQRSRQTRAPSTNELVEKVERWRQAGTTTIWINAFHAQSLDHYLDTLREFGEHVIQKFQSGSEAPMTQ